MATSSSLTIITTLLLIATSISPAQSQAQTCASKLVPCGQYLNATTTPPNTCCDPIKQAVATDLPCLCNLYANPSFLSGIGVNITQALRLPRLCGITSDTSICKNAQAPKGSSSKPPPSGSSSTPGENNAGNIASSGVISLLFSYACMMLF